LLKAGDRNTNFFHKQAQSHLSKNNVTTINLEDGSKLTDFRDIKVVALNFFQNLYSNKIWSLFTILNSMLEHIPIVISEEDNQFITQPIEEAKVFTTIWSLGLDKAPGLDGFPISFYQHFWDLIKQDLLRMLQYSHRSLRLGGNTNSSFLALVPKESKPSSFSRFRPISFATPPTKS
jgi:hypothetical protein